MTLCTMFLRCYAVFHAKSAIVNLDSLSSLKEKDCIVVATQEGKSCLWKLSFSDVEPFAFDLKTLRLLKAESESSAAHARLDVFLPSC